MAKFLIAPFALAGLVFSISACEHNIPSSQVTTDASASAAAAPADTGPAYVDGKGYLLTWPLTASGLINVPADIADQAQAICADLRYDVAYAHMFEFSGDVVSGYFRCRGKGGG
ncbi:MAG: hypothetical protein ACON4P_04275 [Candidatus Puniceispirillales bacterium]